MNRFYAYAKGYSRLGLAVSPLFLILTSMLAYGQTYVSDVNLQKSLTNWSTCVEPACDPGGNQQGPSDVWNKVVNSAPCSPRLRGPFMEYYVAGPPYVNALWSNKPGPMTTATHFKMSFKVCFDQNISTAQAFEADIANFVSGDPGTNYMFGGQCDFSKGVYDLWDQASDHWEPDSNVPCSATTLKAGAWHYFERIVHTDSNGALWFDSLTIDGNTYNYGQLGRYAAGPLNDGWHSTRIWQVQLDIGPSGAPLTMWLDQLTGIAWQ
jgi:hypothetical protein